MRFLEIERNKNSIRKTTNFYKYIIHTEYQRKNCLHLISALC